MTDLVEYDTFTDVQQAIIDMRLAEVPLSYEEIMDIILENYSISIYPSTIVTVLKRSALGFPWVPGKEQGGQYPYLCPSDMEKLKELAILNCNNSDGSIDPHEFLDIAREIKVSRISKAIIFLLKCNCSKIAETLSSEDEIEPSRSWINSVLEDVQLQFKKPVYVDSERADACSAQRLINFYINNKEIIQNCPIQLLLGADETMLNTTYRGKVLVTDDNPSDVILRKNFKIPHMTSLCCHTATGVPLPPFIVLPSLQNLPAELHEFKESGQCWFVSSPSGWICRDLFLIWVLHLINWMSLYRQTLQANIRTNRALLILDGHASRECPIGLLLLRNAKIDVLTLPGHTTHVTQMFDVILASPLKTEYTKLLNKLLKQWGIKRGDKSKIGQARYLAVYCFYTAWQRVCTSHHCRKAAKVCGLFPFNENAVTSSKFVREFTEQEEAEYEARLERRTRFDINSKVITEPEVLSSIAEMVSKCPQLSYLCEEWHGNYSDFCKIRCKRQLPNKCYFLGRLPPFVASDGRIIQIPEPYD